MTWIEFLLHQNHSMLTVHGRTTKQMSDVPANWELIGEAKKLRDRIAPDTLIAGNGDVQSLAHGQELAKKYGLDGIMVGRGIFHDPFLFAKESPWQDYSKERRLALFAKHVALFQKTWPDEGRRVVTLNKFCKTYVNGFDGAKELREKLMTATGPDQLLEMLQNA